MKNFFKKIKNKISGFSFKNPARAKRIALTASKVVSVIVMICLCAGLTGVSIKTDDTVQETTSLATSQTSTAETQTTTAALTALYLSGTSAEKDLKIKIKDENDELIEGEAFEITVEGADDESASEDEEGADVYTDDDTDGIIYISTIEAGDYTVTLSEIEGYEIVENAITVTVNDEIEYEAVDVSDEIKSESEVNTSVEDTASRLTSSSGSSGSSSSSSSSEVLESTKTVRSVSRSDVNTSSFSSSSTSGSASCTIGDITFSMASSALLYNSDLSKSNSASLTVSASSDASSCSYSWASSDTGVVSVSASGSSATITYAGIGTASVTVTITSSDGSSAALTCSVTCQNYTGTTQLTDTSGNLLYIDEDATTAATVADYMSYTTFYLTPLYTGWQTINGSVYYFNEDNEAVTGIQTIGGTIYTFASDGMLQQGGATAGIDVSKWQGSIDWDAVADAGIDFVIIRLGYRGSSSGSLVEDSYYEKNIKGATTAGIKVGVYFFTQAITEAEAIEEASMCIELVSGYKLTYPIFIDTESSGGRADSLSVSARTKIIQAFCKTIVNSGYKAGVYASKSWYTSKLTASSLSSYYIWVAQYNTSCTYSGTYHMWQYSSSGSISGISGSVDLDISYLGF